MAVKTLFLDIETYHTSENYSDAKIVLIGASYEGKRYLFRAYSPNDCPDHPSRYFEKHERDAVLSFWNWYRDIMEFETDIVFLVGWNIVNFDLPLLYSAFVRYGVDPRDAWYYLFHKTNIVDLRQAYLFLHNYKLRGSSLRSAAKELLNIDYDENGEKALEYIMTCKWFNLEMHIISDLSLTRKLYYEMRRLARRLKDGSPQAEA